MANTTPAAAPLTKREGSPAVTALLKVTRRRFAARFRARFRAFFLDPGIQPLPVPDPAPHGSAPCAAAVLLLPLLSGSRYTQPPSYPYC